MPGAAASAEGVRNQDFMLPGAGAGAAKGIGLACASCLGHEGCKVVVADIDDDAAAK